MGKGVELQGNWVADRGNPERDVCVGGAGTGSICSFGIGRFIAVPVGSRQRIAVALVTRPISASTWRS
jgi:hypothetical protein